MVVRSAANALRQVTGVLSQGTSGKGFYEITDELARWLQAEKGRDGLLHVFLQHTSASLTIQENADPRVQSDLLETLERLGPESGAYAHNSEGPDDMPAHIKAVLTATELSIPVRDGNLALGTWQGVYVIEHRVRPHDRRLLLTFQGV